LLTATGVPGPYILVGHSLGGVSQTLFAARHPAEVAGLLLIDPSHRDQFDRLPAPPAPLAFAMTQLPRAAVLGVPQLLMRSAPPVAKQTRHVRTTGAEIRAFLDPEAAWRSRPTTLGSMPVCILTAGNHAHFPGETDAAKRATWEVWKRLHEDLIASSTSDYRRHEIVAGAGHYLHQTHRDSVVNAARELVQRLERGRP
jgi:pimeloyl-ACP methyl ester carboxylesterase